MTVVASTMNSQQNLSAWWYHRINGQTAETLLLSHNTEGAFLLRPSASAGGGRATVLSVLIRGKVIHVKVLCSDEFYQLEGDTEQFGSLCDMISHYRGGRHAMQLSNGLAVRLTQPFLADNSAFLEERWFHSNLSGKRAAELLEPEPEGSFLVRLATRQAPYYVISIRGPNASVVHVQVQEFSERGQQKFRVSPDSSFCSVAEVVNFYKRRRMVAKDSSTYSLLKPLNSSTIKAKNIKNRINDLGLAAEEGGGFSDEYMQLNKHDSEFLQKPRIEGFKAENRSRNRFKNILPYDETRVVLKNVDSVQLTDYINANHILPEMKVVNHSTYIASQGPLQATVADFWRMIWQQDVRFIVMTTKEIEGGKSKCARYWPSTDEPVKTVPVGNTAFIVRLKEETQKQDYAVTRLELSLEGSKQAARTVQHFLFLAWPDHSVPQDPNSVLRLLTDLNEKAGKARPPPPAQAPPIVVHCSAGIGRTGTFIILDILIRQLQTLGINSELDIFRATRCLRSQRPGMIQTESQYKFVYMAILKYIEQQTKESKAVDEVYCT